AVARIPVAWIPVAWISVARISVARISVARISIARIPVAWISVARISIARISVAWIPVAVSDTVAGLSFGKPRSSAAVVTTGEGKQAQYRDQSGESHLLHPLAGRRQIRHRVTSTAFLRSWWLDSGVRLDDLELEPKPVDPLPSVANHVIQSRTVPDRGLALVLIALGQGPAVVARRIVAGARQQRAPGAVPVALIDLAPLL